MSNPQINATATPRTFEFALAAWEDRMRAALPSQAGGRKYHEWLKPPAPLGDLDAENHYDPLEVYYNVRLYTGDPSWDEVIGTARYQWIDLYMGKTKGIVNPYRSLSHGAALDYLHTGNEAAREAVLLLGRNATARENNSLLPARHWGMAREVSLALMTILDGELVGAARRKRADDLKDILIGHIAQWTDPTFAADWFNPALLAVQCFKTGLVMRSLIAYWDRYRDPAIPPAIKQMIDYLWEKAFDPTSQAFPYWDRDTAPLKLLLLERDPITGLPIHKHPSGVSVDYDGPGQPIPAPALNPLIGPAYAWYAAYAATELEDTEEATLYRSRYEAIFIGSTSTGEITGDKQIAKQKIYNQAHFWEAQGLRWRQRSIHLGPPASGYSVFPPTKREGRANEPSGSFLVELNGETDSPVRILPSDLGLGGVFLPQELILTSDSRFGRFLYVPPAWAAGEEVQVAAYNYSDLPAPPSFIYAVQDVAPLATGFRVTPPASPSGVGQWSADWTVALEPPGSVPPRTFDAIGGLLMFYVNVNSTSGDRQPTVLTLSSSRPSATFQFRPKSAAPSVIIVYSGDGFLGHTPNGLKGQVNITYTAAAQATAFTLTGPSEGLVGEPSKEFVVTPNGIMDGFIGLDDGDGGGTFLPRLLVWPGTSEPKSFIYTPSASGPKRVFAQPAGLLAGLVAAPPALTYTAHPQPTSEAEGIAISHIYEAARATPNLTDWERIRAAHEVTSRLIAAGLAAERRGGGEREE